MNAGCQRLGQRLKLSSCDVAALENRSKIFRSKFSGEIIRDEQSEIKQQDDHLHLRALVLEPELDLERLQPELPAQLLALLVVRVRAFLEEAGH